MWKDVVGFEGYYEVSSSGEIRSLKRREPKILKKVVDKKDKHYVVTLCGPAGTKKLQKKISVLVLEAFVGTRPVGLLACHKNGVNTDDQVENLYWGTYQDNNRDTVRHGTHRGPKGETHHFAKLSDEDVRRVFTLHQRGWSKSKIAAQLGCSAGNIYHILKRDTRKNV